MEKEYWEELFKIINQQKEILKRLDDLNKKHNALLPEDKKITTFTINKGDS